MCVEFQGCLQDPSFPSPTGLSFLSIFYSFFSSLTPFALPLSYASSGCCNSKTKLSLCVSGFPGANALAVASVPSLAVAPTAHLSAISSPDHSPLLPPTRLSLYMGRECKQALHTDCQLPMVTSGNICQHACCFSSMMCVCVEKTREHLIHGS